MANSWKERELSKQKFSARFKPQYSMNQKVRIRSDIPEEEIGHGDKYPPRSKLLMGKYGIIETGTVAWEWKENRPFYVYIIRFEEQKGVGKLQSRWGRRIRYIPERMIDKTYKENKVEEMRRETIR